MWWWSQATSRIRGKPRCVHFTEGRQPGCSAESCQLSRPTKTSAGARGDCISRTASSSTIGSAARHAAVPGHERDGKVSEAYQVGSSFPACFPGGHLRLARLGSPRCVLVPAKGQDPRRAGPGSGEIARGEVGCAHDVPRSHDRAGDAVFRRSHRRGCPRGARRVANRSRDRRPGPRGHDGRVGDARFRRADPGHPARGRADAQAGPGHRRHGRQRDGPRDRAGPERRARSARTASCR